MSHPVKPPTKTTKPKLAPAFVVTVALFVAPTGCGGDVVTSQNPPPSSGGTSSGGNGGSAGDAGRAGNAGTSSLGGSSGTGGTGGTVNAVCPSTAPTFGTACNGDVSCSYPGGPCGELVAACEDNVWTRLATSCNPPAPACPAGEIVEGTTCPSSGFGQTVCPRTVDGCDVTFVCQGTWKKTENSCATCPPAQPADGTSCDLPAELRCSYKPAAECQIQLACEDARWKVWSPTSCSGPVGCPTAPPQDGGACPANGLEGTTCSYAAEGCQRGFVCEALRWRLDTESCDEPAQPACAARLDASSCGETAACRWLVPGCGEPALPKAGCFPKLNCASDADCVGVATCQPSIVDPCAGKTCDACGAPVLVCR